MSESVVSSLYILNINFAISSFIKLVESSNDDVLSSLVHLTNNCSQELVVGNPSISVNIKNFHNRINFSVTIRDMVSVQGTLQLLSAKYSVTVLIHNVE